MAVNALHLVNVDFLNKLADNLGCELFDISVLTHKTEEAVNIDGVFFLGINEPFKLIYPVTGARAVLPRS